MKNILYFFTLVSLVLFACGGSGDSGSSPEDKLTGGGAASAVATVEISGNDAMQFDLKDIKVKAGQTVKLTLTHSGKLPKEAMGHNWVLLQQGVNMQEFAMAAMTAVESDYVPASEAGKVIAHTQLIGGGESTTIEFPAPPAGTYEFLCSFPGHSALMQGKFIVE